MKKLLIIIFLVTVVSGSCKKDVPPVVTDPTLTAKNARDDLYGLMNDWYLWYKEMPVVTVTDYKDPYELMTAMRYKLLDRWSFVDDYDKFIATMQGTFVGHGIRIGLDQLDSARIVTIYKNSPLYSKGVRRGWIIRKLNGKYLAPILAAGNTAAYNALIGPSTAGITNKFFFQIPDSVSPKDTITITSAKASFQVNSVMVYDTLRLKSGITGHLVFDQFIEPSTQELQNAFSYFKAQNVTDLILDLRYNSGGILDVATDLASYIAGTSKFSTPFVSSKYNDKHATAENATTNFKSILYPLNLTRLVIITTRSTASASEVIINGLKPHLTVTTIGDTTNGKPTGMRLWTDRDIKYIFAPITFKLVNSAGQGDFFAGFAPAKYVTDDVTRDFKDKNELCLKEAIYFLENGTISTKGAYIYKPSVQFSEKPAWMNNLFKFDKATIYR
jgi:carboxyl-terminal processing protease